MLACMCVSFSFACVLHACLYIFVQISVLSSAAVSALIYAFFMNAHNMCHICVCTSCACVYRVPCLYLHTMCLCVACYVCTMLYVLRVVDDVFSLCCVLSV